LVYVTIKNVMRIMYVGKKHVYIQRRVEWREGRKRGVGGRGGELYRRKE
jgi:hypothetical protein